MRAVGVCGWMSLWNLIHASKHKFFNDSSVSAAKLHRVLQGSPLPFEGPLSSSSADPNLEENKCKPLRYVN